MANPKVFNGRIVMKHDTEGNWRSAVNFIPKRGEIIIYEDDNNYSLVGMKVGDGINYVADLPFIDSALQTYLMQQIELVDNKVDNIIA
jgi:hypothetical protein